MATVQRLQNVFVAAREPGKLGAFYESALGLQPKFRDGERWIQYGAGGSNVAVASLEEAAPVISGLVMVFEVDDFEGMQERVTGAGGEVIGVRDMGSHGSVLSLRDPEGNVVQLFKRAPKPA
ncbi:VOC family protein [Ramlibacter sp.]|uniref:VOC family protein n=1 Tax=Ramlibacter sp. TaxID=1917967 RepID=UPI003D0DB470